MLIDDMPSDPESLRELMHRVGGIRSTHYGDIFHVVVKANANNLAYLPVTLGLHADLPYYGYNPGVSVSLSQLIHFLHATCILKRQRPLAGADSLTSERSPSVHILSKSSRLNRCSPMAIS